MTSLLSRIAIRWKVALNPAILTLLLVVSGLSAIWMLDANQRQTSALMSGPIVDAQRMQTLATKAWSVQARLYQLVATVASESDADKITAETKKLADRLAGIETASRPQDDAKLQELWDRYFKLAKGVLDMADTDAGSAMMLMMGATRAFDALDGELDKRLSATSASARDGVARLDDDVAHGKFMLAGAIVAAVVIAITASALIASDIARPLRASMVAMHRLSHGDYNVDIPGVARRDELGEVGRTLEVFRANLIEAQKLRADQRDSEARAVRQRREELQGLAGRFESVIAEVVRNVSSAASNLERSAQSLSETATAGQKQAAQVEQASEQTASNVQSVATATAQLGSSVSEISRQVQESSAIASEAVQQASRTDIRVNELSEAAARVGSVVELIASIASQTNLLALNATIEAARAGEAGRGFAVVAEEVKTLAGQTAKATSEIGNQIARMRSATEEAVATIREIGATITRMAAISGSIASAVEQQGHVTQEISRSVQGAADGTTRVVSNIAELRGSADHTGSASAHLLGAARSLSSSSSRLGSEVEKFLSTVRAA